jgi:hypothetical protein
MIEDKLEYYILKFINLNAANDLELKTVTKKMDEMLKKRIDELDIRLKLNVKDMKQVAQVEISQQSNYQNQIDEYVSILHSNLQKLEEQRLKDINTQVRLNDQLLTENKQIKMQVKNQESYFGTIQTYLQQYNMNETIKRLSNLKDG